MSNFPNDLQTPLTRQMKLLDEAGLCAPLDQVHQATKEASAALKACDEALWAFLAKAKAWQVQFAFAPAKLSPVLDAIGQAASSLHVAHEECMKIAHDKGIKVFEGGGK
tara:strand:- start:414 stop:740 length:327 start_codon:yes stop_codon:yes gene_type:complete